MGQPGPEPPSGPAVPAVPADGRRPCDTGRRPCDSSARRPPDGGLDGRRHHGRNRPHRDRGLAVDGGRQHRLRPRQRRDPAARPAAGGARPSEGIVAQDLWLFPGTRSTRSRQRADGEVTGCARATHPWRHSWTSRRRGTPCSPDRSLPFFQGGTPAIDPDGRSDYDRSTSCAASRPGRSLQDLRPDEALAAARQAHAKAAALVGLVIFFAACLLVVSIGQVSRSDLRAGWPPRGRSAPSPDRSCSSWWSRSSSGIVHVTDLPDIDLPDRERLRGRLSRVIAILIGITTLATAYVAFLQHEAAAATRTPRSGPAPRDPGGREPVRLRAARPGRPPCVRHGRGAATARGEPAPAGSCPRRGRARGLLVEAETWTRMAERTTRSRPSRGRPERPDRDPAFPRRFIAASSREAIRLGALQDAVNDGAQAGASVRETPTRPSWLFSPWRSTCSVSR